MIILLCLIAFIIGIILGLYVKNIVLLVILILIILFSIIIIKRQKLNKYITKYTKIIDLKKLIILLSVSFLFAYSYMYILEYKNENKYKNINEELKIEAKVVSNVEDKEYKKVCVIQVKSINGDKSYKKTRLKLSVKKANIKYGDKIIFIGEYKEPEVARNNKGFNYKEYLKTKKIYGLVTANTISKIEESNFNILIGIHNLSNKISNNISQILEKDEAGLLTGILIGNKEYLDEKIEQSFRDSNLSHMLAVSGAHVSYVILGITILLQKVKIHKKLGKIITIILLIFFMVLTGTTSSVTRACIMAIYILVGNLIYKRPDILVSISISMFIILIINPYQILDIGFQLSYGGTIGIVLLNNILSQKAGKLIENIKQDIELKVKQKFKQESMNNDNKKENIKIYEIIKKITSKIKTTIKDLIIVSLSANIVIFPIMMYHYSTISLTFLISNILAGPILGIIIILGFITVFVSFVNVSIAKIIAYVLAIFLKLLIKISNFTANMPLSKIYVKTPSIFSIVIYYLIILVLIVLYKIKRNPDRRYKRKIVDKIRKIKEKLVKEKIIEKNKDKIKDKSNRKRVLAIILIFAIVISLISIIPSDLKIYFIDVGQGDSTLVITPNGKKLLIDGGGSNTGSYDVGKNTLLPYLLNRKITKLDYVVISHFDSDHVGGLLTIINELKVKNIIISKQGKDSSNYKEFIKIITKKKINVIVVKKDSIINIEKNVKLEVIWPEEEQIKENILNNNSIVMRLNYNNFKILFTGDIEKIAEEKILEDVDNKLLQANILKVAHHRFKNIQYTKSIRKSKTANSVNKCRKRK